MSILSARIFFSCLFIPFALFAGQAVAQSVADEEPGIPEYVRTPARQSEQVHVTTVSHILGSYHKVILRLSDARQYDLLKDNSDIRGLRQTLDPQTVLIEVGAYDSLAAAGLDMSIVPHPEPIAPAPGATNRDRLPSEALEGEGWSEVMGNNLRGCDGSCDVSSPHYPGGVDLDCGISFGTYAWWRHQLPYDYCIQRFSLLEVGYYGSGSSYPDNGPDVYVWNWSKSSLDLIVEDVGTDEGYHLFAVDSTLGNYIDYGDHYVDVELYASTIDCTYLRHSVVHYYTVDYPADCDIQTALTFPDTDIGTTSQRSLRIHNYGCQTLEGTISMYCPDFSLSQTSYSVPGGTYQDIDVYFSPTGCGPKECYFNVGIGCGHVTASGTGTGIECDACCGMYTGGITGNANCSEDGKLTLSDISRLIDRVYISKSLLCCEAAGNTNGSTDCKLTLSDISRLIDAVYISKLPPAACMPSCY